MKKSTNILIRLADKLQEKWLFRGEFSKDLIEYFQAIHENLTLLIRELQGLDNPEAHQILREVIQLPKLLKPGRFLRFDFNREYGVISNALDIMDSIKASLNKMVPAYPKLTDLVMKIDHDLEQSHDLFMRQNQTLDKSIMVDPTRMEEQVDTNIDQIAPENMHPDSPYFEPESVITENEENPDFRPRRSNYVPFNRN